MRRLLWKWNDEAYIENILDLGNDPNSIEIKSFGNENLEKNLFLIEVHGVMGLGGYMRHTLHALFEAENWVLFLLYIMQILALAKNFLRTMNLIIPLNIISSKPVHSLFQTYIEADEFFSSNHHIFTVLSVN